MKHDNRDLWFALLAFTLTLMGAAILTALAPSPARGGEPPPAYAVTVLRPVSYRVEVQTPARADCCSPFCSCPCNRGGACTCPRHEAPAPAVYAPPPALPAPVVAAPLVLPAAVPVPAPAPLSIPAPGRSWGILAQPLRLLPGGC